MRDDRPLLSPGPLALVVALVASLLGFGCEDPTKPPAPAWTVPAVAEGEAVERCFVLGDMGTGLEGQRAVAALMSGRAAEDGLDLILTVGDNFYPSGVASVDDPQWESKLEDVYDAPSLAVPIRPTLGNHDHRGSVEAQVAYSEKSDRWRMPAPYYAFTRTLADGTEVRFFALDTEGLRQGGLEERRAQLDWLERALEASAGARWRIAYGHHPPFTHGHHAGSQPVRHLVVPLLEEHDVDLYLAGHNHHLEVLEPRNGVQYVVTGGGAGAEKAYEVGRDEDTWYASTGGGFLAIRMSGERLVLECVEMSGETGYAWVME